VSGGGSLRLLRHRRVVRVAEREVHDGFCRRRLMQFAPPLACGCCMSSVVTFLVRWLSTHLDSLAVPGAEILGHMPVHCLVELSGAVRFGPAIWLASDSKSTEGQL